ncbi:Rha family transcriptional regulator [Clostridium felsineum]|uniref:Uncharacterized protein n=1 Tax=Clostridium felsineum TaxID=36839 RepID=A0A1S8M2D1_9CLOT|nr:Rha family transcriptional regulator [Clostridium felsineum]URZ06792.1 hypothetical protein CLROS_021250 [Clostridium felsineum]URZ11824.1 hypothetical protein CROST_025410 [Clostridium felsineum]
MEELTNIIANNNGVIKTIKSTALVEVINEFRKAEGGKELKHKNFMAKIEKEIETLKTLGLEAELNFKLGKYFDKNNQERPCYEMSRDGMLQMLNSESTLVRYKTIEYVNKLEEQNKKLKSDNKELYTIATSDKDQIKREYKANIIKFGWKNLRGLLADCTYKNIEDVIGEIMNFHVNKLKKKDRAYSYSNMSKTEYKQAVRSRIDEVLDNIYNTTLDGTLRTVVKELQETTLRNKLETTNRKNAQELNKLKQVYPKQIKLDDYIEIHKHPFAKNYMYEAKNNSMYKTYAYKNWINAFPNGEIANMEYWENKGVDFDLPIKVYWRFVTYNGREFDTDGLIKAVQDQIFNRIMQIDDSCIDEYDVKIIGRCNSYEYGKIYYYIENVREV